MVLVDKFKSSFTWFMSKKGLGIIVSDVLERKQTFHNNKKINSVNSKNIGIFQRG